MRYQNSIIERARFLRREGKTYSEISERLGIRVPKSTLSCWCSNVALPGWFQQKVEELNASTLRRAQQMARVRFQRQREEWMATAMRNAGAVLPNNIDLSTKKLLLAMLHLGEGTKSYAHSGLMLGSTDEKIIRLYLGLLQDCYQIQLTALRCRVSYRVDQDINALQRYWSRVTLIPLGNFYKTKPDPRTSGKSTKNLHYKGVCVISCLGSRREQLELEELAKLVVRRVGTTETLRAVSSVG